MLNLLLTISHRDVLSAGLFLLLNAAAIALLCSLYTTYLFFLFKKRIRTGRYEAFPLEE